MLDSIRGLDPRALIRSAAAGVADVLGPPSADPSPVHAPGHREGLVLVRQGYTLERIPNPKQFRRVHVCHDLADFAAQIKRLGAPGADVFVQAISLRGGEESGVAAIALLDPEDPDSDVLSYVAQHHARWKHWRDALGRWLSAAELRELVLIGEVDTAQIVLNGQPIGEREAKRIAAQLRKVRVVANAETEVEIDDLGMLVSQVKSGGTTVSAQIPATFGLELPVVQDLDLEVQVGIRVQARVASGAIQYALNAPGLSATEHQIRVAIRDRLRALLGEDWTVSLGLARTDAYIRAEPPPEPQAMRIEVVFPIDVSEQPAAEEG